MRWADAAVEVAAGLGDSVGVLGLSMGGGAAAWTAQNRAVDRVVTVSPALSLLAVPGPLEYTLPNLVSRLPNFAVGAPRTLDHAYGGETISGAGDTLLLGHAVLDNPPPRHPRRHPSRS